MAADPEQFFKDYVLAPYEAWIADELCEWKAFAVVNGLNALVDHACHHANPDINEQQFKNELNEFRKTLQPMVDLEHIRSVAEVHKHFKITLRRNAVPKTFDKKDTQEAGAFSKGFSNGFDTVRPQIGFPYGTPETWVPLRPVVRRCIEFWRSRLGLA
jgi:hypothetical protein